MDQSADKWYATHGPCDRDHWFLFSSGVHPDYCSSSSSNGSVDNDNNQGRDMKLEMMQQIVNAADACQQPIYSAVNSDVDKRICEETGYTLRATERMKDPVDDTRPGFEVYIFVREPLPTSAAATATTTTTTTTASTTTTTTTPDESSDLKA